MIIFLLLVISIFTGYIIGSIPSGYVLVKIFHNKDIRQYGSGNIGATNIWRNGYKKLAVITFLLDAGKAIISGMTVYGLFYFVNLLINFSTEEKNIIFTYGGLLASSFAVLGHIYSCFLKFKGGKGISTFFGYLLFTNQVLFIYAALVWMVVFALKRISSLSAMSMIFFSGLYSLIFIPNYITKLTIVVLCMVIIYAHKQNIAKLLNKTEKKL